MGLFTFEKTVDMATPIAQKLKIKENFTLRPLNAPSDFQKQLGKLPVGVKISATATSYDQVHWFVMNQAQLNKELSKVLKLVKENVVCWVYYPKGSSKLQTDLTRDKGWDDLLNHDELKWISLISFDDTWSTFGFRQKTDADRKKEATPAVREIFNYVDPEKKTVKLPVDMKKAMDKSKKASAFFTELSFTNKKEYIEWIVTAKREETRSERVKGTIERLEKGWKNPRNA